MTSAEYNNCVDEHADGLYRFILKNIRDEDEARDIVQDTFEKMWRNVAQIQEEKSKSYLFTAGYHTMIDRIRRKRKVSDYTEVVEESLYHTEQWTDLRSVLNVALEKLSDIQRSVLLLRDYEGYSYSEIGQIAGLNESQVKVYIYRARLFLKEYIGALDRVL